MIQAAVVAVLIISAASSAQACPLVEEEVYDDLSSEQFAFAVAEVTALAITKTSETQSCFAVDYRRIDVLRGDLPATFRAETCDDTGPITLQDFEASADEIGFVAGATVLVGVMQSELETGGLRHAVPDCWGPLHLRLDLMGEIEREVLLAYFRDMLAGDGVTP